MSSEETIPKVKPSTARRIIRALLIISAILFLLILSGLIVKFWNMSSEYNTGYTINDVTKYVEENKQWPKSWAELPNDYSEFTDINFSLTINSASEEEVMASITPKSKVYYTYPRAKGLLKSLWKKVKEQQYQKESF